MKHRSSFFFAIAVVLALAAPRIQAAISIPLTIQEALFTGSGGAVTRSAEPVSVGIPLPDDAATGATEISQLTLTGTSVGQFRVLGRWPSGRIKWVLVDTLASLSAGGMATGVALATGGTGNFGGADLATDNGGTITVATGTATFTIRKANFNGFDQVVVDGTTVVAPGTSTGLVVTGPAPGGTSCGTCTTVYSSANDPASTAVIEENGPVRTVIRATGSHKDASGNEYMKFTVRMHFYKGLTRVKATTSLRNADFGTSNSFAAAYKGHMGYEWRVTPALTGTPTYQIAKHGGAVESGTLGAGADNIHLYQGETQFLKPYDWCASDCVTYTTDTGYRINKAGSTIATGTDTQVPQGWADIRGTNGAGISIGLYQFAAHWPKSLEFNNSGADTRIGIWARQNSRPYYQAWPQWSTHDLYFNFHGSALASPANEFLKFQQPLLARAALTHYNATRVFPYPIVAPAVEDAFFATTQSTANPTNNFPFVAPLDAFPGGNGTSLSGHWLAVWRYRVWGAPGESNQQEFRHSWLMNWIQRGFTGRYQNATHFYRFQTDDTVPHSDGFNWRDHPNDTDPFGRPAVISANKSLANRSWFDQDHAHWYGMPDFYFMTGDELVKESILDGYLDYHLDDSSYQAGDFTGLYDSRADGILMVGAARMASFLTSIGRSSDAATVLNNAADLFADDVKRVLCTSAEQASQGCTTGAAHGGPWPDSGISRTRGMVWSGGGTGNYCGTSYPSGLRLHSTWASAGLVLQGLLELSDAKGTGWNDYWLARDLAYGITQGNDNEGYVRVGNNRWDQDHWRSGIVVDVAGACASPTQYDDYWEPRVSVLSIWNTYYAQYRLKGTTDWANDVRKSMLKAANYNGVYAADFYASQLGAVIHASANPSPVTLQNLNITSFTNNGGGSYTIGWTVPTAIQNYRIKWGPKRIVEWIGFNPATNTFTGDPNSTMNWFAANNHTPPAPGTAGTVQTTTISTGNPGLTVANFSVKAYVAGAGGGGQPPTGTAANLVLLSGNNQTGTAGMALSSPLTVKVADTAGTAVAGAPVNFAVIAGGGSLTNYVVITNDSGVASTVLTLGSAGGTNTVTATSGTLTGSPVTFTAVAPTLNAEQVNVTPNQWVNVVPTYEGAPNGGYLAPQTYNNMGVYDPASKRTISFERWYDTTRSMSIYANALVAYEPKTNVATVLKVTNWAEGYRPLPANITDPTPIDRHPMGGLVLDPTSRAIYLVNGANQGGRVTGGYPDHPNDTWKFSLDSRSWSLIANPITNPSTVHPPSDVISYSGMVHDPSTGKVAYFIPGYPNGTKTWLFNPTTNLWSAAPLDATSANVYISAAGIAYDSLRSRVLAFGGGFYSTAEPSKKLWAYSVSQNKWTALADAPIGGAGAELAYDSVHDVFLALVGQATLIYNPRTNAWVYLAAVINRGGNLSRQNVTYNPAQDVFVFQGGRPDAPVWSLFRYRDGGSPAATPPGSPGNLRVIR